MVLGLKHLNYTMKALLGYYFVRTTFLMAGHPQHALQQDRASFSFSFMVKNDHLEA
jgi:hypothetical protein